MMKSNTYLSTELFLLFVLLPISLVFSMPIWIKVALVLLGFIYVIITLIRVEKITFKIQKNMEWSAFWKRIGALFLLVVFSTTAYVYFLDATKLFCVPKNNPTLWVFILFVYTFLSVWPQELIYRTFFISRYSHLFQNKNLLIFINGIVFCLAHIFFRNTLVLVLTFIGGLFFAFTYLKTKSTLLVSIEHALYGNWLFTVGMGQMLAFPGMESC